MIATCIKGEKKKYNKIERKFEATLQQVKLSIISSNLYYLHSHTYESTGL